ncbi:MAG: Hpt domain-containing protein, partial [Rickettsiales bacterium]
MDDLIVEFITETSEGLATLDLELVKLEQNPQDEGILGNIFRIMHTIKGTCGFLGLPRLERVAHASENVLGKIREKQLEATPEAITLVLESLDSIKGLIDYLSQNGEEQGGDDAQLIGRLNQFAETGKVGEGASPELKEVAAVINASSSSASADDKEITEAIERIAIAEFPHFKGDDEAVAKDEKAVPKIEVVSVAPAAPIDIASKAPAVKPVAAKTEEKETKEGQVSEANQSIRVNIDVLENLMQMVSELVLTRNQLMQIVRTKDDKELITPLQQLSHITSELQEGVMKTRMQPIGNGWSKFPRLIRDLSIDLGKKIELKMHGAETELDRQLLEVIKDPLTHMVRNSCDHGLETPAERRAAGKPEVGTVTLSAYHEGGHIIIEIIDDGRG